MSFTNPFSAKVTGTTTITATEVNAAGLAISRAMDGVNGGTNTLLTKIVINGAGIDIGTDGGAGLVTCRSTGAFTRAGSAATMTQRIDLTTAAAGVDTMLTIASDIFVCVQPTAQRDHGISNTGAVAGMTVLIKRKAAGAFNIIFHRNALGGAAIVTLPSATASSVLLGFDGTNWVGLMTDGGTKGADWD